LSDSKPNGSQSSSILPQTCVVDACELFEIEWRDGRRPRIEDYLDNAPSGQREFLLRELVAIEIELRVEHGENPTPAEYRARYPRWGDAVTVAFDNCLAAQANRAGIVGRLPPAKSELPSPTQRAAGAIANPADVTVGSVFDPGAIGPLPARFGRYEVTKALGSGGFGTVYLAHDGELSRPVAIKVPRAGLLRSSAQVESFLAEARNAAALRHPAIVAVHDVGHFGEFDVFVVFEYVEGRNLAELLHSERLSPTQIATLMVPIAEAADHAHRVGLVHRDLKPSNILIDSLGRPHITDFGLAIREELQGLRGGEVAGTPHYMSPEQVRGETHRLDSRTDVWAAGVILYRCLLGHLPFAGRDYNEIFAEILNRDPKPPRQIDDKVPRELERICLKCLSRRMADRYETAADLADDLKRWLVAEASTNAFSKTPHPAQPAAREASFLRVVPKGLRAFDLEDADFFLTLVPGTRDRDGLPEAIRSWKRRIEERDKERTFSVGLLYGPSGSGKSSLVKAGLLPRLSHQVRAIYVEASHCGTEAAIRTALLREFPDLAALEELELLTSALRDRGAGHPRSKVLLVLDQFEQWLESHRENVDGELVCALRQCDGLGLQALLLVRDDFWMATTRFLKALEIRLFEGVNSAPVELFDRQHAVFVLAELGRALGRIPDEPSAPGPELRRFLEKAVAELTSADGRVIPVRLTLFAEMIRRRDWTAKTLRELGGIEGIGEIFLEESFSARSAPMAHRVHERAAQSVLQALLPDPRSDLRDRSKPVRFLREASGYHDRPGDFNELMYILDNELRMVTAVDPLSLSTDEGSNGAPSGETHYQLTHDYLVPSLRQWLTRKQRQTRRGRAELQLAMITALWCDRPDSRRLPSLLEWLRILSFTRPRTWNNNERRMMKRATRHFIVRAIAICFLVGAAGWTIGTARSRERAHHSLQTARTADFARLPELLDDLRTHVAYLRPTLERLEKADDSSGQDREVATLVLFRDRPTPERAGSLLGSLLTALPDKVKVIGDALSEHPKHAGLEKLSRVTLDDSAEPSARLRAACVLARLDPASAASLTAAAAPLAEALLAEHPHTLARWIELLGPARRALILPLSEICGDRDRVRNATARSIAAEAVAEILARQEHPELLAGLIVEATPEAWHVLLREQLRVGPNEPALDTLRKVLDQRLENPDDEAGKDAIASHQASAAVALAVLGQPEQLWPLLRHRSDPRLRTLLIERLAQSSLTTKVLMDRLLQPDIDPIERQAILLAWAEMPQAALPYALKATVIARARVLFLEDPDPGVHSAAELVLRRWADPQLLESLREELESAALSNPGLRWATGPNEHTFAILPGPLEFRMGAPPGKGEYYGEPVLHYRKIDRSIMVATKEVSLEQFQKYQPAHTNERRYGDSRQCAATRVSWYEAAAYCNWLSAQAGIPRSEWCYPENPGPGMTLSEHSVKRTGFRLPTEAEWECFCRAGTDTTRPFGESPEFLSRFAWTWLNSNTQVHPPGQLLPNEFGLFDVLGNAWEWCQDGPPGHYVRGETDFPPYPAGTKEDPASDPVRTENVDFIDRANETWRILRGGAFSYSPDHARSAYRDWQPSSDIREYLGVRVVRTMPPRNR
jgi:serine/threonine protein kinase/formylglycine-generating enzyme required for sulfatase activity